MITICDMALSLGIMSLKNPTGYQGKVQVVFRRNREPQIKSFKYIPDFEKEEVLATVK